MDLFKKNLQSTVNASSQGTEKSNYDLKANFTKILDATRVHEMLVKFESEREGRKGFPSPKMVMTVAIKP